MKFTTGYDFQGYAITEYYDVVFDEMLVGIGMLRGLASTLDNIVSSLTGTEATEIIEKLNEIKIELRKRVEKKALAMGGNALIGIDFESSRLGDLIMVSMTATVVRIERLANFNPETIEGNEQKVEEQRKQAEAKEEAARKQAIVDEKIAQYGANSYKEFVDAALKCERFSEVKVIATEKIKIEDEIGSEILKMVDSKAQFERMYGGTKPDSIEKFIDSVLKLIQQ